MICKYNVLRGARAFSLVEVTLALGVMAFAIIPLVSLLPIGLKVQRDAIWTVLASQITARVSHEAQQTDFSALPDVFSFCLDAEGNVVASGTNNSLFSTCQDVHRQYDVQAIVIKPTTLSGSAALPGGVKSPSLATIKIAIALNPSRDPNAFQTDVNGTFTNRNVSTCFAFVSRND